jgi:uncharacterized membrane protein YgaE (UPF0421/DUF939 family)
MPDNLIRRAFVSAFVAPASRRSLLFAGLFAAEAAICAVILWFGYTLAKAPDLGWAIVSAFLVLQPEFSQSLAIAFTRVAANLIGAAIGLIVGATIGIGLMQLIIAIILSSMLCGLLRLDAALRTACVAIVIVMNANRSSIIASGEGRFASVTIGCLLGVLVQMATLPLTRRLRVPREVDKSNE